MDADSTQKPLSDILDEIEERATVRWSAPQNQFPNATASALVKALRESRIRYLVEVGADSWEHKDFDAKITAILNQGRSVGDNKGDDHERQR